VIISIQEETWMTGSSPVMTNWINTHRHGRT
jgi:hypothetical protein